MKYYYCTYEQFSFTIEEYENKYILLTEHPLFWYKKQQSIDTTTIILFWSEIPVEVYNEFVSS